MVKKIRDGCYIDFEGFAPNEHRTSPPPVLIGVYNQRRSGKFRQVVFRDEYRWTAEDPGVGHDVVFCDNRNAFLRDLMTSVRKKKPLFAFTEHELKVINKHLQENIVSRYRNVRTIAKRWFNSRGDNSTTPPSWDLAELAKAMDINLTSKLARGGVTSRFRAVSEFSCSRRKWAAAPQSIRKKWREILEHNKSDVMSIRKMMMVMRGLDES
jgi:hypothetical protein